MESTDNPGLTPSVPTAQTYNMSSCTLQKTSAGWKIFFAIVLALSLLANLIFFALLVIIGSVMFASLESKAYYNEKVIQPGPVTAKIAIINIHGIIQNETAKQIEEQINNAYKDNNVKALIFRIVTPGGAVGASDRINHYIQQFKAQTGKPAVAFMDTIAASGGYYAAAACDEIVAEPTVITGSIGVVMGHFVFQELLEMKLGIKPIIVKSGPKKDWPTAFEPVSDEQIAYLKEKLIMPTYERFVDVVATGRRTKLTRDQVKQLADGSIYNAKEALENNLIDKIGYLQDAIQSAKDLANIKKAKVIEYEKPFSLEDIFGTQSIFGQLSHNSLYELTTPQMMYLWHP